jgi:hypothetical protein
VDYAPTLDRSGAQSNMILELIERVLKDPTLIYEEVATHTYHLFYRLETGRFVVVVVKQMNAGSFFSAIYTTGKNIRNKHKKLKRVKI